MVCKYPSNHPKLIMERKINSSYTAALLRVKAMVDGKFSLQVLCAPFRVLLHISYMFSVEYASVSRGQCGWVVTMTSVVY